MVPSRRSSRPCLGEKARRGPAAGHLRRAADVRRAAGLTPPRPRAASFRADGASWGGGHASLLTNLDTWHSKPWGHMASTNMFCNHLCGRWPWCPSSTASAPTSSSSSACTCPTTRSQPSLRATRSFHIVSHWLPFLRDSHDSLALWLSLPVKLTASPPG